jgi:hypothetical protein
MGKAYVFDHFGITLYPNGQLASSYNDFSYIDIDKDDMPDLTIGKDGTLKNIPITLSDGTTFILQSLDLSSKYFSSFNRFDQSGIDIQLNPDLLHTLISNTISDIEISLAIMLGICSLCIENNSNVGNDKLNREETVYNSIQEVFRGCNIPLILENLYASIEVFKNNVCIFDILSTPGALLTRKLKSNERIYNIGIEGYRVDDYNSKLRELADEAVKISELCNFEKCDDPSSISETQTVVIKSWRTVEKAQRILLEASNQIFEGDGLRAGRNDAIQQSITDVLDVEEANIKELQNLIINLKSFMTLTTLSFDDKDNSLGTSLETGMDFSTGASVSGVPQSYETYLNRSEIFDDVKDVLQAFDI